MKIGVLGSGDVAQTLAAGLIKHGYQVMVGTRDAGKLEKWRETNPKVQVGSSKDAAAFGEAVLLAVKDRPRPKYCALRAPATWTASW